MKFAHRIAPLAGILLAGCASPLAQLDHPSVCPIVKEAVLPVSFTPDGLPMVDVQINGHTEHMIVDTGAVISILNPKAAASLHLGHLQPAPFDLIGAGGEQKKLPSTYGEISLGGWHVMHSLIVVHTLNKASSDPLDGADGSVGNNIWEPFDVDLDLPQAQITLYLPQDCVPEQSPPPWQSPSYQMKYINGLDGESTMHLYIDGKFLTAIIDTGSVITIVPASLLKLEGILPKAISGRKQLRVFGYGAGSTPITIEQFDRLSIGGKYADNLWLAVGAGYSIGQAVIVGDDYLRHQRIFLANSLGDAYFELPPAVQASGTH